MSCPLACWGDSFLAAPCPCHIRSMAKAEELSLAAAEKRPLAFPGENLRSICVLQEDGDGGDSPAGAGMSPQKARDTQPPVASIDGAQHRMPCRNLQKCGVSPLAARCPPRPGVAAAVGWLLGTFHPSHTAKHTLFFRVTCFQWSNQKQLRFAFKQHRIIEYPELEGTHKDHHLHLLHANGARGRAQPGRTDGLHPLPWGRSRQPWKGRVPRPSLGTTNRPGSAGKVISAPVYMEFSEESGNL